MGPRIEQQSNYLILMIGLFCALVYWFLLWHEVHFSIWMTSYWEDVLFTPILLAAVQVLLHKIYRGKEVITFFRSWIIVLYCSLVLEVIFPWWSTAYTADWMDVVYYHLGLGMYWGTAFCFRFLMIKYSPHD